MIDKINLTGKLRKNTTTINSFVCKTRIFYFQGKNIYCQVSYFYAAFTEYSFIRRKVGRNASYVALKSFLLFNSYCFSLWLYTEEINQFLLHSGPN